MADEEPSWLNKRSGEALWEEVQTKTFKGWVNMHLKERKLRVNDLEKDLGDGVKLIALLEILSQTKIEGRYYRNPKSKPYKIDNVNFALTYIADVLHVSLISCSAEDVVDGNIKIILGMVWKLIQKFQLPSDVPRQYLLAWVKQLTKDMPEVTIESFHRSFKNGLAFCGIVQAWDPALVQVAQLDGRQREQNLTRAFELVEEAIGVPSLLDPADISQGLADERSIMTYLSMINRAFEARSPSSPAGQAEQPDDEATVRPSQMRQVVNAAQPADAKVLALEERNSLLMKQVDMLVQQNKETQARLDALAAEAQAQKAQQKAQQADDQQARDVAGGQAGSEADDSEDSEEEKDGDEKQDEEKSAEEPEKEEREKEEPEKEEQEEQKEEQEEQKEEPGAEEADANEPETEKQAKEAEGERGAGDEAKELEDTRRSLKQQIQVGETLQKSLEDAREELGMVQKKHKRATEKALKKQQKRHEKRLLRRDRELEAVKQNAIAELQQKSDEIKRLKLQLKKAQAALGERAVDQETTEADEDIVSLKAEYEDILSLVSAFEEEEQAQMKKAARPRTDDADDDDGMEE